jgi:hypothetical protein
MTASRYAIGTKRFDSDLSGDREVQRTMLELLNQLDGFSSDDRIKEWRIGLLRDPPLTPPVHGAGSREGPPTHIRHLPSG